MELLPSGSCCLFTVVPACVHGIAQLGRYLKFLGLGFISNQSCAQSLVSKDEKNYIVWWTIECLEEYPPGKLVLTELLTWAAPAVGHTWHGDLWGWIPPWHWSMEGRVAPGVLRLHLQQSTGELIRVLPRSLCPHTPTGRDAVPLGGSSRAAQVGCDWLQHVWSSHPLSCAHVYIFEYSRLILLLLPLLWSLPWLSTL